MGCDIWITGSQSDIELQKLACTIRIGQTQFPCFTPKFNSIPHKINYIGESEKKISKYYDNRITGVGNGLLDGIWFDNMHGGMIVSKQDYIGDDEPDSNTLYLKAEENVRLTTGMVYFFIEAFLIRQRCIPNLYISDDYYLNHLFYYIYCGCGGRKRVALASPNQLYSIKKELILTVQALYYFLYEQGDDFIQNIDKDKYQYRYMGRLIKEFIDDHYQSIFELEIREKRLTPIYDLLLSVKLEKELRRMRIYTVGDLIDNFFGSSNYLDFKNKDIEKLRDILKKIKAI